MYFKMGRLHVSPLFVAVVIFFCTVDSSRYTLLLLLAAGWHESAHILAAKLMGAKIEGLYFRPFGINMKLSDRYFLGYKQEIIIALAGPIASILAAASCFFLCMIIGLFDGAAFFMGANALLFALNILPIDTLDGGRAFHAFLLCFLLPDAADRIALTTSIITLVPLALIAMTVALQSGYNFSLLAVCLFLLLRICTQNSSRISIHT